MDNKDNKKFQKSSANFICDVCDYSSCRKSQFDRHLKTKKHVDNLWIKMDNEKVPKHLCECGKYYNYSSGLCKHKKKCDILRNSRKIGSNPIYNEDVIIHLLKQNDEFKNLIIEQTKNTFEQNYEFKNLIIEQNKITTEQTNKILDIYKNIPIPIQNNTTITNSNNKTFNLNLFLNETCKDAMNMSDFVNSIKIQLSDLENVGEIGFIDGITDIIVKNLKGLDITQRPIHCTDSKRETMYIKDENKWEKENEEHVKLRKAIKHVAYKNRKLLLEFKKKYPEYSKSESIYSDKYNKLVVEVMGKNGDNDIEKENKIIRKIAKEVIVEK